MSIELRRPSDLLDLQAELIQFYGRNPIAKHIDSAYQNLLDRQGIRVPMSQLLYSRLNVSETVFLRSHIQNRLWQMSADTYPHEEETVEADDLPFPAGFMFFEQALYMPDAYGDIMALRAVSWSVERNGVLIVQWVDGKDPQDQVNQRIQTEKHHERAKEGYDLLPLLQVLHLMFWRWGTQIVNLDPEKYSDQAITRDLEGELSGTAHERAQRRKEIHAEILHTVAHFDNFLLMVFEFMGEVAPRRFGADRAGRRRMERLRLSLSDVLVVELRTHADHPEPNEDPEAIHYSHRFRVREHKRRWIDKRGVYRETTVHSYIKGPPDRPLIEKDRVFDVKR